MSIETAKEQMHDDLRVFADSEGGAVFLNDFKWHPFCYFTSGEFDIIDEGYKSKEKAFKRAKEIYT